MQSARTVITIILVIVATCQRLVAQTATTSAVSVATAHDFQNVSINGYQTVYCVAHDSYGMTWVGTENGLYSFDGYNSYAHFVQGAEQNTRVLSLCLQGDTIYMGTEAGFFVYDIRHDCYRQTIGTSPHAIRALALHKQQLMLGGNEGLFVYDLKTNTIQPTSYRLHNIYSMLSTPSGLLVGCIDGLYKIKNKQSQQLRIVEGRQTLINAILQDADKKHCWIGTEGHLYRYDGATFSSAKQLDGNSVKSLAQNGDNLYVGTDNGLYILKQQGATEHIVHDSRTPTSIPNNIIWSLTVDRWHNLWLGTDNRLSIMLNGNADKYLDLSYITLSGDGNSMHSMLSDSQGTVWMGGTNGLIRFRPTYSGNSMTARDVAWYRQNSTSHHIPHNRIRRLFEDRDGNIIVCTDHGLNIYNGQTGQFRNVVVTEPSGRYTTAWAYDIVDDGQGRYWIGSYMGGVFVIRKSRLLSAGSTVVADKHFSQELSNIHVAQLALDQRGNVWVVYYDKGVDHINTRTMSVKKEMLENGNYTKYLITDSRGNVWIAVSNEIIRIDAKTEKRTFYKLSGRTQSNVEAMFEVAGQLWVVMGRECSVFRQDGSSYRFTFGNNFTAFAGYYDQATRKVVFGGNDGIMQMTVDGNTASTTQRLTLSCVLVNGKPLITDDESVRYIDHLRLAHDAVHLSLRLSDLPYTGNSRNVYAYRLSGIDNEWQYLTGSNMEINYDGLPHGKYRLTICTVDGEGKAAAEVFAIDIRVLPPWYLTIWAKLIYLIIIIALVLWATNFYMMRRRLAQERRERQMVMEQSQARTAFFANLSRRLKSPISQIMTYAYQLLPEEPNTQRYQKIDMIRRQSTTINQLVSKAFDFTGQDGDNDAQNVKETRIDFVDFCRRMTDDLRSEATQKKITMTFKTDTPNLYVDTDIARVQQLLYAFLQRVISATPAGGNILLNISTADDAQMQLKIDELRIDEATQSRLFYRYYAPIGDDKQQSGAENELAKLKEYVEVRGGSITVDSDETSGTTFQLRLSETVKGTLLQSKTNPSATQKSPFQNSTESQESKLLAEITSAVEAHIADTEFNVSRLQEVVGIGEKLLYRRVKQLVGKTPVEFIRYIRMQRAAILLREGRFTVSEVMYMVGFSNASYFAKCFQKTFGITPTEYSRK